VRATSKGGGAGSRLQSLTVTTSPISSDTIACLTRLKLGSKRRCSAVISFTPASLQALIASIVSARSVAIGFSAEHATTRLGQHSGARSALRRSAPQKTCLPAAAQALI